MGKASRLFNGAVEETLYNRVTPTEEQRQYLQKHWNTLAENLTVILRENYGYPIATWIQGSYKFGTLIKPVRKGEEYDVDLGLYFQWERNEQAEPAPEQLRRWVQRECEAYASAAPEIKEVVDPAKERCSRLVYDGQFHIDVPVYHLDPGTDERRLATLTQGWEPSDPQALYEWFRTQVGNPERDQLRRVIRYLKGWAAVTFDSDSEARPSSVMLTVLATNGFAEERIADRDLDDDDALYVISDNILRRLIRDSRVANPVTDGENLNRISQEGFGLFLTELGKLVDAGYRAMDADDEASAALAWSDALSYLMPLPEADEIEVIEGDTGKALMTIPNIRIDITDRKSGKHVKTCHNEVESVPKDCDLKFTITNPEIIPPFSTIEWTVRNHGDEAQAIGDLGHRNVVAMGLEASERTAYFGKHFMDCVIRRDGFTWAVRRVPVNVRVAAYPARNPPRPAWTRLRSMKKRR